MPVITVGLLEDEPPQAELLLQWLSDAGYATFHSETGGEFISQLTSNPPDMVIMDWQLPDCEGIDVLQKMRLELAYTGPVLFATARESEDDIVRCLSCGADDYLVKPLRRAELLARLTALWRRSTPRASTVLELGPIRLDRDKRVAFFDDQRIKLTRIEFDLAVCMIMHKGELLSRDFLLKEVWGVDAELDTRTVDVHIGLIRRILKIGPNIGYCIETVYRHGYRLEAL